MCGYISYTEQLKQWDSGSNPLLAIDF